MVHLYPGIQLFFFLFRNCSELDQLDILIVNMYYFFSSYYRPIPIQKLGMDRDRMLGPIVAQQWIKIRTKVNFGLFLKYKYLY